jgi:hypothetical protein
VSKSHILSASRAPLSGIKSDHFLDSFSSLTTTYTGPKHSPAKRINKTGISFNRTLPQEKAFKLRVIIRNLNMTENTFSLFPLTMLKTENTSFLAGYTPHLRGGGDDSDDGYEAENERNDDESADEASDDDSGSGAGTSTAADHWDDSDGDSDNCYTSDNGS